MGERFERLIHDAALPRFRAQPGLVDVRFGVPTDEASSEFLVITVWRDVASLRGFAGPRWNHAVMTPAEREIFEEATVRHYRDGAEGAEDELGAILRGRSSAAEGPRRRTIDVNGLVVDPAARRVLVEGRLVDLPPLELTLLLELLLSPGVPVPTSELARRLWPGSALVNASDVRRIVYRLRRLLGDHRRRPPLLRNRRGHGYVLEP